MYNQTAADGINTGANDMTTKQLNAKKATFSYLLAAINDPENEGRTMNDEERIRLFFDYFRAEFDNDFTRRRWPVEAERVGQYLQGLPSCIDIDFADYAIIERGRAFGYDLSTERKQAEFCRNWFKVCGLRLVQLHDSLLK